MGGFFYDSVVTEWTVLDGSHNGSHMIIANKAHTATGLWLQHLFGRPGDGEIVGDFKEGDDKIKTTASFKESGGFQGQRGARWGPDRKFIYWGVIDDVTIGEPDKYG